MIAFADDDILALDERFAAEGIPFHARPLRAATELLSGQLMIDVLRHPCVEEVRQAYARLIPEVEFTWPGMGTGLAASVDRVKKVIVGVAFGSVCVTVSEGLGFTSHEEWEAWCRGRVDIATRSAFAFADMHDLVYGIGHYCSLENAKTFWGLAAEQLRLVAESLSQSGAISSAVLQPISLAVELAMKGTLLHLGTPERELRNPRLYGHNLKNLAKTMIEKIPHRDDALLLEGLSRFPDYVGDRYRETTLGRMEVIELALHAQFVSASAVRRVSGEDLAIRFEENWPGSRSMVFSKESQS